MIQKIKLEIPSDIPPFPVRKFTVAEYHRLIDAGILHSGDPYELLEGWIVPKMAKKPSHAGAVQLVNEEFPRRLPVGCSLRFQDPITTVDSEPEPDIAVVRGKARHFIERHPTPAEVGMLIEVSDTTLAMDRRKCRVYARAGIKIDWIVNLVDSQIEVYTNPTGPRSKSPRYRKQHIYGINDKVPLVIDGKEVARIPVRDLLP